MMATVNKLQVWQCYTKLNEFVFVVVFKGKESRKSKASWLFLLKCTSRTFKVAK